MSCGTCFCVISISDKFRERNVFFISIICGITGIDLFFLSNGQTYNGAIKLTREEKEKREIVSNKKKKGAKRIERKYKTKHINTSWYAPLDSFIF
jgi:hypothetical protein